MRKEQLIGNIDKPLLLSYIFFIIAGLLNIYAVSYDETVNINFDLSTLFEKQLLWVSISLFVGILILFTDPKLFNAFAYVIYGIIIVVLIAVIFIGKTVSGAKSWIVIGNFALQPVEFAKFASSLALARFLSKTDISFQNIKIRCITFFITFIPAILVLLQNDTGSAIVFLSFFFVFYREGLSKVIFIIAVALITLFLLTLYINKYILIAIMLSIMLIIIYKVRRLKKDIAKIILIFLLSSLFVFSVDFIYYKILKPHQRQRIDVLIGREIDPKKAGYNIIQSKIAIGSGGLLGKGYLQGTQTKYNFVPEQKTDFIFCTIGEEWGFIGTLTILCLFLYFIKRIITLSEKHRSKFSRIYGYSIASLLFFHVFVNIGMTLGILPVIGIPLPFFSYGGSSLLAFSIMFFVFLKQTAHKTELI